MAVFRVVAPCSLVEFYQRFRGPCCQYHQGDHRPDDGKSTRLHGATTQKTAIFILILPSHQFLDFQVAGNFPCYCGSWVLDLGISYLDFFILCYGF
jgi:hypothetical protein